MCIALRANFRPSQPDACHSYMPGQYCNVNRVRDVVTDAYAFSCLHIGVNRKRGNP